ncbi:unconventional myosin-Va isoform X3 [Vespula maculifrons]|uniref:Unconventional myosin-Va isoform X3 n=1 Tax=Vespula maculifrons TaxID=7453 RepID=A0ABD2BHJ4_VESMC
MSISTVVCQNEWILHGPINSLQNVKNQNISKSHKILIFLIHHLADLIQQKALGFLTKNRDIMIGTQIDVLRASEV